MAKKGIFPLLAGLGLIGGGAYLYMKSQNGEELPFPLSQGDSKPITSSSAPAPIQPSTESPVYNYYLPPAQETTNPFSTIPVTAPSTISAPQNTKKSKSTYNPESEYDTSAKNTGVYLSSTGSKARLNLDTGEGVLLDKKGNAIGSTSTSVFKPVASSSSGKSGTGSGELLKKPSSSKLAPPSKKEVSSAEKIYPSFTRSFGVFR